MVCLIEWRVYKHSSEMWKNVISATPKNCEVSVKFDMKL